MLNFQNGRSIAMIKGGLYNQKKVKVDTDYKNGADEITLREDEESKFIPVLDNGNERNIYYITGPSGSGKSTLASELIKEYAKNKLVFIFSRTNYKNDPVLKDLKMIQITIDDKLLEKPINIEKDIKPQSVLFFDDITTIQNDKLKNYIQNLICDGLEVGRKLRLHMIITNHLIIPNERKYARTIMNEIQNIIFFPKSGQNQQINYALKTYWGLTRKQIKFIMNLNSRWCCVSKLFPLTVCAEKCIYLL